MNAFVLEGKGRRAELFLFGVITLEVELWRLHGVLSERFLKGFEVHVLVICDRPLKDLGLAILDERPGGSAGSRFVVEGRLEVLEGERVVEDANVTLAETCRWAFLSGG